MRSTRTLAVGPERGSRLRPRTAGSPAPIRGTVISGPGTSLGEPTSTPHPLRSRRPIVLVLLGGLFAREAFSFWTGHPFDFESWVRTGYVVSHGGNPYSAFWPPVAGVSFAYLNQNLTSASYLPFWPVILAELYRLWVLVGGGNRFVLYFLLKQPGIVADVVTAYLLYRLAARWTGEPQRALMLAAFWSFFPYAIVITAIWGQFDSIVVVILLALLYAHGPLERNLINGLGIFVKWVTVVFLPLEVFRERGTRRLLFVVGLAIPAFLTVVVFLVEGWSFQGIGTQGIGSVSLSQSHGGGEGMNYAYALTLPSVSAFLTHIPLFYSIAPYVWVPGVIGAGWAAAKWLGGNDPRSELRAMLLVVTVFLLLRWGLYEQYFLYLFSLLALDVAVFNPGRRSMLAFTYGLATIDLLLNNDLGLRFLSPLNAGISTYTTQLDASDPYGAFRTYALLALALAMTVTLVQLLRVFWRDAARPRAWFYGLIDRGREVLARRAGAETPSIYPAPPRPPETASRD